MHFDKYKQKSIPSIYFFITAMKVYIIFITTKVKVI